MASSEQLYLTLAWFIRLTKLREALQKKIFWKRDDLKFVKDVYWKPFKAEFSFSCYFLWLSNCFQTRLRRKLSKNILFSKTAVNFVRYISFVWYIRLQSPCTKNVSIEIFFCLFLMPQKMFCNIRDQRRNLLFTLNKIKQIN